ncbi:MAG: hypothetical protein KC505_06190 [Myxococcales bacterium]|nr:hypothetical protein [Myxococcales bacterium]USN51857.1 MAG: hypothetical protein H6731_05470 [Myxococcales bacterium]
MFRLLNVFVYTFLFILTACVPATKNIQILAPSSFEEPRNFTPPPTPDASENQSASDKPPRRIFFQRIEVSIPLDLPEGSGLLNADVYRPEKKSLPKTLVIIVPGSGNISRRGETAGDGIDSYEEPVELSSSWAHALVEQGYFVLSYDKRTCTKAISTLCQNNPQKDIEEQGITALARDLDQVYEYAKSKLTLNDKNVRIVLLTSTQGAQVISLSKSAQDASGIVLLSPIVGSLEEMWVTGLNRAFEESKDFHRKNRLGNQKESMKEFFSSFKAGRFPDGANIRGASVQFWRSWIGASPKTIPLLLVNKRPMLALFSNKDVFSSQEMLGNLKKSSAAHPEFLIKNISKFDRNFIEDNMIAQTAVDEVVTFIQKLPTVRLLNYF